MNRFFPELDKKLGFGGMRLPVTDGTPNVGEVNRMVDAFMEAGFNYFDTAKGYHSGQSETICPQHLPIRKLMQDVAAAFEK